MSTLSRYQIFLKQHLTQDRDKITHTRIGDKDSKIYGGAYHISDTDMKEFYALYTKNVIENGVKEYLTEKQLINKGPIVIDLDFRYPVDITHRQHTVEHITDFIYEYFSKLTEYVNCTEEPVPVYIMEKPKVNRLDTVTKDGIHILIGLQVPRGVQLCMRDKMLGVMADIWTDLGEQLTNDWDGVFDLGIVKGGTNWQLFGSRKINHDRYWISNYYKMIFDSKEKDFDMEEQSLESLQLHKNVHMLSVRNIDQVVYPVKESMTQIIESTQQKKHKKVTVKNMPELSLGSSVWYQLISMEKAKEYVTMLIDGIHDDQNTKWGIQNYYIIEAYEYTLTLPESYYGAGSYDKWMAVGWALRNTDYNLFPVWLIFSAQSKDFDWSNVSTEASEGSMNLITLMRIWTDMSPVHGGKTLRSLMYWSKQEDPTAYQKVKDTSIGAYVDETLNRPGILEYDIAKVVYQVYKDNYTCVSVKNNIWYEYKNGRWHETDQGTTLRHNLSVTIHKLYRNKSNELHDLLTTIDPTTDSEQFELLKDRSTRAENCASCLKKTQIKGNIMKEARDLFYVSKFEELMDSKNHLLCFNNGVIDFDQKCFREGIPEDYNSKSTYMDYKPLNRKKDATIIAEVETFMKQLFPIPELRRYMWDHLASCLIGKNENQTFNIYTGVGRNGKSKLVELMGLILGDYKGSVPITLITQKRGLIGGTSSEVVNLRGTRYAVMQESSKGDQINEGIMKELTGGDPITARGLYANAVTFTPQFKLAMCTNNLFDIKSNDDGTWRRIRICDFKSLFTENPVDGDKDKPYQFKVDKKIDKKFEKWATVFMALLVERAFETDGDVIDSDIVMASSAAYRADQDYLAEFVKDQIVENVSKTIRVSDLKHHFSDWYKQNYDKKTMPKQKEVVAYMDKRFGKCKGNPKEWLGIGYNMPDHDDAPPTE